MTTIGATDEAEDYGPLCLLRTRVGVEVPVQGEVDDIQDLLNAGKKANMPFVQLANINGDPLVINADDVVIFSAATVQKADPQPSGPDLMVPVRPPLQVPGRDF